MSGQPDRLVQIVAATPADREATVGLWRACGLVVPHNPPHGDFDLALGKPGSDILIASDGDATIGSVMVGHDGHRGWIYYLAVAPGRQGEGIGRRLVEAAEVWLREHGIRKIQLMVRANNERVIGFYEALGYEKSPVVVMQRWLTES